MAGIGGQATQAGIDYQNKIATLFLGRMIDPGPWPENDVISAVRNEDPTAEVDDVVLYYQDKHTVWIQVKLDMEDNGETWIKFWKHMINQWWSRPNASDDDRLVLAISQTRDWVKGLEQICDKAFGSSQSLELASRDQQVAEWYGELSKDQVDLIKKIVAAVSNPPKPKKKPKNKTDEASTAEEPKIPNTGKPVPSQYVQNNALFELFSHMQVWTQYHPDKIESDHGRSYMPQTNLEWDKLFDVLFKKAGSNACYGKSISRDELVDQLRRRKILLTKSLLQAAFFQVPPLPEQLVPRPEVVDWFKQRMQTIRPSSGVLPKSGIHAMGGSGKTLAAAYLAHEFREEFVDGVLWVELKRDPNLQERLDQLYSWIHALNPVEPRPESEKDATDKLRRLLIDRSCLLIIDNVWDADHAEPFLAGGPKCHVLITCRRKIVAKGFTPRYFELPDMSLVQALELLEKHLGRRIDEVERKEAEELVEAVGYHPLALTLVAARVADGKKSWVDFYQPLKGLESKRQKVEHRKENQLKIVLNMSLVILREEDVEEWEAFVWLGILPRGEHFAAPMCATLWMVDPDEAEEILNDLENDALLRQITYIKVGNKQWPAYQIHDLLYDLAVELLELPEVPLELDKQSGLGLSLAEAHAKFLERYRGLLKDGKWHTLPDDGYIFKHLAWHLEKAGKVDEIQGLFNDDAWLRARVASDGYQYGGYLADLQLAWNHAYQECQAQIDAGQPLTKIVDCIHLALIRTSINSLSANYHPRIVARAVELKLPDWNSERVLSIALRIPNAERRFEMLLALLSDDERGCNLLADGVMKEKILDHALKAALAIGDERSRTIALSRLGEKLDEEHLDQVLLAALTLSDEKCKAKIIRSIGGRLEDAQIKQAFKAALAFENEDSRIIALSGLAEKLEGEQVERALQEALTCKDEEYRAEALSRLAKKLEGEQVERALQDALAFKDEECLAESLSGLAEKLDREQIGRVMQKMWAINNRHYLYLVLSGLLEKLEGEQVMQALNMVLAIEKNRDRYE